MKYTKDAHHSLLLTHKQDHRVKQPRTMRLITITAFLGANRVRHSAFQADKGMTRHLIFSKRDNKLSDTGAGAKVVGPAGELPLMVFFQISEHTAIDQKNLKTIK